MIATVRNNGERTEIETKYGRVTLANSDFGYGYVTIEDGKIVYRDMTEWKEWRTAAGFERWADKQNKICGGVFDRIDTREYEPRTTVLSW